MASSKTSSQPKHDYVIAKMKREEIEKQNEAAIRLAKQKKQMEIDELEENNRKRLAEATLREFEWTPFLKVANLKQLQVLGAQ